MHSLAIGGPADAHAPALHRCARFNSREHTSQPTTRQGWQADWQRHGTQSKAQAQERTRR